MLKKVYSTTILLSVVVKLFLSSALSQSLKQPTCCDTTTGFSAKCRLRNERRNSILMTCHYSDQSSASDWSCREGNLLEPIRRTAHIWVVTRHGIKHGISAFVTSQECRLFSQASSLFFGLFVRKFSWRFFLGLFLCELNVQKRQNPLVSF